MCNRLQWMLSRKELRKHCRPGRKESDRMCPSFENGIRYFRLQCPRIRAHDRN